MSLIEDYAPGSFCWLELATSDQDGAKKFYGSLFGWEAEDIPMGPGAFYTMFKLAGGTAAAGYTLAEREQGAPPHWNLYISVENADESAKVAAKAGGKVMAEPFDVYENGRMAVIQDPTGAMFCLWQKKSSDILGVKEVDGSYCWADLSTPDPARASKFYGELFSWKMSFGKDDNPATGYMHIQNGEEMIGGIPPAAHRDPHSPPHWLTYLLTSNCDATAAKAKELGGKIYFGPMAIENTGRYAVIADPQGATFAAFEPIKR